MPTSLDIVRDRLRIFSTKEAGNESPLYAHLAAMAADDDDIAGLLTVAEPEYAWATLLMAAAHRLVLADPISELARYYPSIGGDCGVDDATWPTFRSFVLDRADRVRALVASRTTQTNEVRRAAVLYPAVALAAKQAAKAHGKGPIGLLEIGTSAGLLLGLDRYAYRYVAAGGDQIAAGPAKASVVLHSVLGVASGAARPAVPKSVAVGAKVGIDRRPVDLRDEEQLAWLEACVWADQPDRVRLLNQAAAAQAKDRPTFVTGDMIADLAAAAALVPAEQPLVVISSYILRYLPVARHADLVAALGELAATRPLWWINQEDFGTGLGAVLPRWPAEASADDGGHTLPGVLTVVRWPSGKPECVLLGRTAPHGERMQWSAT